MCISKSIIGRSSHTTINSLAGSPQINEATQSSEYSVTDNNMTNSEGFNLLKSFIA